MCENVLNFKDKFSKRENTSSKIKILITHKEETKSEWRSLNQTFQFLRSGLIPHHNERPNHQTYCSTTAMAIKYQLAGQED